MEYTVEVAVEVNSKGKRVLRVFLGTHEKDVEVIDIKEVQDEDLILIHGIDYT